MMNITTDRQVSHEALGLACLSLASGCTDVLTFLNLGDVFTSAMTGNTALLAIAIGRGQMLAASRSSTAVLGFMLGVALAAAMGGLWHDGRRALRFLLLFEIVCLGGCAALWSASDGQVEGSAVYAIIVLSAVSMGIQGTAARRINSSGISTIVFTSVLISIVMHLAGLLARGRNAPAPTSIRGHVGTFVAYFFGAFLAAGLVSHYLGMLVWVPMAAVSLALGCSYLSYTLKRSVE
jgi:uncharacterized membrane protein YoaK (UPF0700 family)